MPVVPCAFVVKVTSYGAGSNFPFESPSPKNDARYNVVSYCILDLTFTLVTGFSSISPPRYQVNEGFGATPQAGGR